MTGPVRPNHSVVEIQFRDDDAAHHPMRLLAAGVPLSLLLDLASPSGPDSASIATLERPGRKSGQR